MKISRPARFGLSGSISLRLEMVCTAGIPSGERVRTIVVRLGNGLPMASNVFRPMTITWPVVIFLNHLKSSGRCQGILFPAPITRFSDIAAMALKGFTELNRTDSRKDQPIEADIFGGPGVPIRTGDPYRPAFPNWGRKWNVH